MTKHPHAAETHAHEQNHKPAEPQAAEAKPAETAFSEAALVETAPESVQEVDLAAELAQTKDHLLRAMAETENTRRRMRKEAEDAQKYAISSFAKEILVVSDNFSRALESMPKEGASEETLKNLVTGVEATERQLQAIFERFGIKKIDPMGLPFDPHFHRVMMEIEDLSKPAGTVVQVLQAGYMIHDRLLREALVAVSKGGAAHHSIDQSA
jgi:molecular chaperone GrpE